MRMEGHSREFKEARLGSIRLGRIINRVRGRSSVKTNMGSYCLDESGSRMMGSSKRGVMCLAPLACPSSSASNCGATFILCHQALRLHSDTPSKDHFSSTPLLFLEFFPNGDEHKSATRHVQSLGTKGQ